MTQEPAWGESASHSPRPAPARRAPEPEPAPADDRVLPRDPIGRAAVIVGCVGIFVAGIVAAIVAAILAAESGRRARENGTGEHPGDQRLAVWGFALAVVDAVLWIVVQFLLHPTFLLG